MEKCEAFSGGRGGEMEGGVFGKNSCGEKFFNIRKRLI